MKITEIRKTQEQQGRGNSAEDSDAKFDFNEVARQVRFDETRKPGSGAQSEKIDTDDQGKLSDGIAEHIARQRAGDQFVNQPAGGDDQHMQEKDGSAIHYIYSLIDRIYTIDKEQ